MGNKANATNCDILNNTLKLVSKKLNERGVKNWFIGYGTLLGITRDGSCIPHDDDVDIMVCMTQFNLIKEILSELKIEVWNSTYPHDRRLHNTAYMIKTKPTDTLASVDFYFCRVSNGGTFFDIWDNITWVNCFNSENKLDTTKWRETSLNIPHDVESKLIAKYGIWWKPNPNKDGGPSPNYIG